MNAALALSLIIFFGLSIPVAVSIALASIFGITFFSSLPLLVVPQPASRAERPIRMAADERGAGSGKRIMAKARAG